MKYAPFVLVASILGLAVSFAPIFNMGIFLKPLVEHFGWTRTQVSAGAATATFSLALAAPFIGRIIDRIGPRRLIVISSTAFALAIALLATLPQNYLVFLLICAIIGVTGAGTTPLAYLALVARWFDRRLGLAMGVAMMGIGFGMALSPLVATQMLGRFGLSGALVGMAAIAALAIPNALFVLRDGEYPVGDRTSTSTRTSARSLLPAILSSANFWCLALSVFLMTLVAAGCAVHMIALLTDRGYPPASAAAVASAIGVSLLVGRLLTGILLDHVPVRFLASATFLMGAAGAALLAIGTGQGALTVLAACLVGFSQGAEGDIMAFAVRRCFGIEAYGLTYGLIFAAFNIGAFGGPLMLGHSFDQFGGYEAGLAVFTAFALCAAVLALFIRPDTASARPVNQTA